MAKHGRKTAADFAPVVPGYKEPVHPPADLSESEREIWLSITSSLPPDWFAPETRPLLKELCCHIALANDLRVDLAEVRAAMNELKAMTNQLALKTSELRERSRLKKQLRSEYYELLDAHGYQSRRIGELATKLRLTVQSKTVPETAAKYAREMQAVGQHPWEDWKPTINGKRSATHS